jgi:hypothetical protein
MPVVEGVAQSRCVITLSTRRRTAEGAAEKEPEPHRLLFFLFLELSSWNPMSYQKVKEILGDLGLAGVNILKNS